MPYIIDSDLGQTDYAPIWKKLLNLITLDRSHMNLAIEEFIGYALSCCSYDIFNKLLILDGEGSNGKSTLIRVIKGLFGEINTSAVSLEAISKERFAGFNLVNKLINFCNEESKEAFSSTGVLKKLTGGDPFMVEEKHRGAFLYTNLAKFIISYNKMPFFPDDSDGMRRRVILIPCEQNFEKNPHLKLDSPEKKILANERPQIINRCLRAYINVLERGRFTDVSEGNDRLNEMITDSNPVREFIAEYISISGDQNFFISTSDIYAKFEDFVGNKSKYSKMGFSKEFKRLVMTNKAVIYTNNPTRGYRGLSFI